MFVSVYLSFKSDILMWDQVDYVHEQYGVTSWVI
jgi:hypothetical protein